MAVRKKVLVSGRVQGVFFRDECRRKATERGLAGYVGNLPDGRVEAVFEGDPDAVAALVEWCHEGSRPATVSSVEVDDESPTGASGFEVR